MDNNDFISLDDLRHRKITLFERVWWPVRRFFTEIPYNLRKIKWFYQRGKRGWADCDTWCIDYHLAKIVPEMLRHLQENAHTYPGCDEASTFGKWYDLLDEMIDGWEAAKRVCDDDYVNKIQPNWFEKDEKLTKKTLDKSCEMMKEDQKLFEKKAKLFIKWFFHLWD
jgi:hypothetical protein